MKSEKKKVVTLFVIQFFNMKKAFYFTILLAFMACTNQPHKTHLRTEKGPREEVKNTVVANQQMSVEIQGMTCEMGCGSSIRTALKETKAVERVSYDFVEGAKVQKATVLFDDTKVSAEELVNIIEKLNDQQFSVGKYKTEALTVKSNESSTKKEEKSDINMNTSFIEFPNLISILKNLILN